MIELQVSDELRQKHRSKVLEGVKRERVSFNPKSKKHRESLKVFLETGRWGETLFKAELPHVEVPATVLTKLARHSLGIDK